MFSTISTSNSIIGCRVIPFQVIFPYTNGITDYGGTTLTNQVDVSNSGIYVYTTNQTITQKKTVYI